MNKCIITPNKTNIMRHLILAFLIAVLLLANSNVKANDTLIKFGQNLPTAPVWKYIGGGTNLDAEVWKGIAYGEPGWLTANSALGFGGSPPARNTAIPEDASAGGGGISTARYPTLYFRKQINIANPAAYINFEIKTKFDDGIVVWINGVEAFRDNIAAAPAYATLATTAIGGSGSTVYSSVISSGLFVPGNNVIAVEIHQATLTSSDLFFDMELIGNTVAASPFILRPFTQRYNNPSVKGNIVYVSNSIVSSAGIGPGSPGTGEVPPGGSTTNGGAGINIDVDNVVGATIIPYITSWKYKDDNTRPAGWETAGFADGAWVTGNITAANRDIGYGDGDEDVCVAYGGGYGSCPAVPLCVGEPGNCNNKFITTLFRKQFTVTGLAGYSGFQINLRRDDGAIIYINGVEVSRINIAAGAVNNSTLAITGAENANDIITIGTGAFVEGANTIAVEIHQVDATSSDISFRLEMTGVNSQNTYNSSTADLTLASVPACSEILFAGLYWGAGEGSGNGNASWITGENTCKLKIPGAATYSTITSTQTDYWNPTLVPGYAHTGYKCFANITALINTTNANGTYAVADVVSPLGLGNAYGGWTIVIAYANSTLAPRNLTVFDGTAIVKTGSGNVDVNINGFLTPPTGAVSCELGAVVYDGDRTSDDAYAFRQTGAPSFYDLTPTANNPTSSQDDMWNSVIAYKGNVVTTRNPAFQNTLGYDANIIDLPNAGNARLSNNQTGATVRFSSPDENYILQLLTTSISQYTPIFSFDKTATDRSGGTLTPGDSIRYQINYNNVGNDNSINSEVIDNIPAGTTYIPNSLKIKGVAKTDAVGDDEAEFDITNNRVIFRLGVGATGINGGTIPNNGVNASGNATFDVVVASSCRVLSCVGSISNSARFTYAGQTSGLPESDSSGVNTAGCVVRGPVVRSAVGACFVPGDTLLTNTCPATTAFLPYKRYAGYTIYSAMPFIPANIYNPVTPVALSHIYYAYYSNGMGCSDTVKITVFIIACPDIDDDNDGIPDYVELNNPVALQDDNSNGVPNWCDPAYSGGFIDNNLDNYNDNFDPGADSDNDGIPNFYDINFPGFVDSNNDGVNDNIDKDLDGIPNHLDLDSDNDGIPDTVESYGVETDGDGLIDSYTDTDNDGFSQNVDGNNAGVINSGNGLGAQDFDGDGIANYLDTDSDNDGIPDVVEVFGSYVSNNGKLSNFVDANSDGISDNNINGTALLLTGADGDGNGRADTWPNKNKDMDFRPNAYDTDSDGDGITDVTESGLPDANLNGIVDGVIGINGWSATVSGMLSISLRNTDASGNPDYLDIDSDDDGIPDNIEGMSTAGYIRPVSATDTDGDGLINHYDNVAGFSGTGNGFYNHDGDGLPDYRDLDTDGDGALDIVEGNDFNLNGYADDLVTLTGLDTDGDGLDNRFDSLNSVTNLKGTSFNLGTGGTTSGDATPGTRAPVQKKVPAQIDRDWRYVGTVLPVQFLNFAGNLQNTQMQLSWTIQAAQEVDHFEIERSLSNANYSKAGIVTATVKLNEPQSFGFNDDINGINSDVIYYRLKVIGKAGEIKYSSILAIRLKATKTPVSIMPNPANDYVSIRFYTEKQGEVTIRLVDNAGKTILLQKQKVSKGNNIAQLNELNKYNTGVYALQVLVNDEIVTQKLILNK
jgi:uncharacterized repeat protein (TIGR01451 family)